MDQPASQIVATVHPKSHSCLLFFFQKVEFFNIFKVFIEYWILSLYMVEFL